MELDQENFFDSLVDIDCGQVRNNGSYSERRTNQLFSNFLLKGALPQSTILEFGCGKGSWTIFFLRLGYKLVAVDVSQKSLDVLWHLASDEGLEKNLILEKGDVSLFSTPDTFDRVFCYNLLHHVKDPQAVILRMTKALKPKGRLVLSEPNPLNLWWWLGSPVFVPHYKLAYEVGMVRCLPWNICRYLKNAGLDGIELIPTELFPFISPDRLRMIVAIENTLFNIPLLSKFAAINIIGGWKK